MSGLFNLLENSQLSFPIKPNAIKEGPSEFP